MSAFSGQNGAKVGDPKTSAASLSKSKGAVRNLTQKFMKIRSGGQGGDQDSLFEAQESRQASRFGPLKPGLLSALSSNSNNGGYPDLLMGSNNGGSGTYSGVSSPQETEKLTGGNDYVKLGGSGKGSNGILSTKASSDESVTIEYGKRFMPPVWVDIQEEIEQHIEEISLKMGELKRMQQKRMKVNFVDDDDDDSSKSLQRSIDSHTSDITNLVRASESKLKELMKCQSDDKYDEQIRANIQIQLATKLKDITFKLRKREKKHFLKVQEIHDDDSRVYDKPKNQRDRDSFLNDGEGVMTTQLDMDEEVDLTQRHRNKEIKTLVSTINDLAVLFKELSVLVVEQGTILDRIDYNIECAHKDTKQAVVHLENTVAIEKSARSKSVLICLISSIVVCVILLLIKHT